MRVWGAVLIGLATLGTACEKAPCGPGNCTGCCSAGACVAGTASTACGSGGGQCSACSGTTTCTAAQQCGSPLCKATTCAALGHSCGIASDGCGGTLSCGTCGPGTVCGLYSQRSQCGVGCDPLGCGALTCSTAGKCEGPALGLILDERWVSVAGALRVNGAAPAKVSTNCSATRNPAEPVAVVSWRDPTRRIFGEHRILCADPGFAFTLKLPRGGYEIGVEAGVMAKEAGLDLPLGKWVRSDPLLGVAGDLREPETRPWFDVTGAAVVGGRLRIEGVEPPKNAFCAQAANAGAQVAVIEVTQRSPGAFNAVDITCGSPNFSFRVNLPPSRYDLRVRPGQYAAEAGLVLPETAVLLRENAPLSTLAGNSIFDVRTVTVRGRVEVDGSPLTGNAWCSDPAHAADEVATVTFVEPTLGYRVAAPVRCTSPNFEFNARLPERGTWNVLVAPGPLAQSAGLNLMPMEVEAATALPIDASIDALLLRESGFQVDGVLTLNGKAPSKNAAFCAIFPTADLAVLTFRDAMRGQQRAHTWRCDSPDWTYAFKLPPGAWLASVERARVLPDDGTDVPEGRFTFPFTVDVAGDRTVNLPIEVQLVGVQVRVNGKLPEMPLQCLTDPGSRFAVVTLTQESTGLEATRQLGCAQSTWKVTAPLSRGEWRVRVAAADPSAPLGGLLPGTVFRPEPFTVPLSTGNVLMDEVPVAIAGRVRVNGADPSALADPLCSGGESLARVLVSNAKGTWQSAIELQCASGAAISSRFTFSSAVQEGEDFTFDVVPAAGGPATNLLPWQVPVLRQVKLVK